MNKEKTINWAEVKCPLCGSKLHKDNTSYILEADNCNMDYYSSLFKNHVIAHICDACGYIAFEKDW